MAQPSREIRILAILYLLNGVFCLAFAGLFINGLVNHRSVLPTHVSEDIPITGGVIGSIIFGYILLAGVGFLGSCVFFRLAYGLRQGKPWARTYGLLLSALAIAVVLLLLRPIYGMIEYSLTTPWFYLTGGVAVFSLIFLIANVLSLYYLMRPKVKAYLRRPTQEGMLDTIFLLIAIVLIGGIVCAVSINGLLWVRANRTSRMYIQVTTDSMSPVLEPGEILVVKPNIDPSRIRVHPPFGDIIVFPGERVGRPGELIAHRVIEKFQDMGGLWHFVTKGDANSLRDPGDVVETDVVGEVVRTKVPMHEYSYVFWALSIVVGGALAVVPLLVYILQQKAKGKSLPGNGAHNVPHGDSFRKTILIRPHPRRKKGRVREISPPQAIVVRARSWSRIFAKRTCISRNQVLRRQL